MLKMKVIYLKSLLWGILTELCLFILTLMVIVTSFTSLESVIALPSKVIIAT